MGLRKQGWIEGCRDLHVKEIPRNVPMLAGKGKGKAIETSLLTSVFSALNYEGHFRKPAVSWEEVGINPLLQTACG